MQRTRAAWFWIALTAVLLAVDTLSTLQVEWLLPWKKLHLQLNNGFELSTFALWFVTPFTLCLPRMDWGAFSPRRLRRADLALLIACMIAGALVPLVVPYFASLREAYPTQPGWQIAPQLIWVASWLVGWEFLHRYALLRAVERAWPRWGWLWVPASEFIFHLQKPLLEALGMLAFSLLATTWARRRRSILLPLAVHFAIEAGLALLQAGY